MNLTITLPDDLYQRADERANARGESVETLVQELVEQGLDAPSLSPARQRLLQSLDAARAELEANEDLFHTWEEIEAEKADRRGGVREDD
jgi:plasmid stability protein